MKDVKKGARRVENEAKELGDDVRHGLGNTADKAHEDVNKLARDLERRMRNDERRAAGQAHKSK